MTMTVIVQTSEKAAEVTVTVGDTENQTKIEAHGSQTFYVHSGAELTVTEWEEETVASGEPQPPVGDDNEAA